MENSYVFIITIACILLLGLFADAIGKHTNVPRVTFLLIFGLALGVNGFNIIPEVFIANYNIIADIALIMIGFLAGGKLSRSIIVNHGKEVVLITIFTVILTVTIVFFGLYLLGFPVIVALVLGSISTTTDPVATFDVILESKKKGIFVDRLTAVVALDDLFGLLVFSICLILLPFYEHSIELNHSPILYVIKEIFGAVLLGIVIGIPASYLTGRINPGQPLLLEAVGLVLLCGGMAIMYGVSYLISAIVMGAVVSNFASHHEYSFHEIENIEWPIMIMFFTLAGASITLFSLNTVFTLVVIYTILRILGKICGAYLGCKISRLDRATSNWMGLALMPQAGLSIGMALVATSYLPEYKDQIMTVIISTTIIYEVLGPILTRLTLQKVQ